MGYDAPDVYYQPEKFGLVPVAEIDYSDGNYQFDIRMVWKHEDGTVYTERNGGCSCPSPFEDYTSLDMLDKLDYDEIEREVQEGLASPYSDISELDASQFMEKVKAALA